MNILEPLVFWSVTYPVGIVMAGLLLFAYKVGLMEIKGWENFPHGEGGILLTPNHPSLLEPVIMVALFYKAYLRHPRLLGPYTLADSKNYTDKWRYALLGSKILPINRSRKINLEASRNNLKTLSRSSEILINGGNVIIFGEGGRTGSSKNFLIGLKGNKIRPFVQGPAVIALRAKPRIVPVWISIDWFKGFKFGKKIYLCTLPTKIRLSIGKPMVVEEGETIDGLNKRMELTLLSLADKAS